MSFSAIRPFFRNALDSLDLEEWTDGFNFQNIPSTLLDGSYHIGPADIDGNPANQLDHKFDYGLTVRVFKKGFRDPGEALDEADALAESVLSTLLATSSRLESADFLDIQPQSVVNNPLADSNDNAILIEFVFIVKLACKF